MTVEGLRTTINNNLYRFLCSVYGFTWIFIFQKNGFLRKQSGNTDYHNG